MSDDSKRDDRIRKVYEDTGSIRETRRITGHCRKTIRRVLRHDRRAPPRRSAPEPRPSKLDRFKPQLKRLVLEDELTAILAFEELRGMGFDGSYSGVKRFVRQIRVRASKAPSGRVEHPPGEEGQIDWSPYGVLLGGVLTLVHGFSFVLPFSRWQFLRFALDETLETLTALHDEAFAELRRVPRAMSYDNMTTVGRHIGPNEVWINPRFAQFAAGYGFEIKLITPGHPKEHASVERSFQFIENNCLKRKRKRFDSLEDLNRHAAWWCAEVANVRVHGTTRRRPIDQLRIELPYLLPLPHERPEPYRTLTRTVGEDFLVAVDTNGYSVSPRHIGREVTVHLFAERLEILVDGELHAVHVRNHGRHQPPAVLPEHADEFKKVTPSRRLLESAFVRLGPAAKEYYEGLRSQRGQGAGYHLKRILRLADRYGTEPVVAAMSHAARYGNYGADAVARVIAGRKVEREPPATPPGEVPMPPDRVRRWLEGLDVEDRDLGHFDALLGVEDDEE